MSHLVLLDQCVFHLLVPTAAYKIIIQRLNIIIVWPMAEASSWLVLHITHRVHWGGPEEAQHSRCHAVYDSLARDVWEDGCGA